MRHRKIALAAVVLATCLGCHSPKPIATTTPEAPVPVATPQREYAVANYTATVEGINVVGQIRLAKDSLIWINASKIIEVGRAMASPDSVWLNAPMLGQTFAGTYADLERQVHHSTSFATLQEILLSDNADAQVSLLANRLGFAATVHIEWRPTPDQLSFPFQKRYN